jgi:hypothetical protein
MTGPGTLSYYLYLENVVDLLTCKDCLQYWRFCGEDAAVICAEEHQRKNAIYYGWNTSDFLAFTVSMCES